MNTVRQPSIQLFPKGGKGDRPLSRRERVWVRAAVVRVMPPATKIAMRGISYSNNEAAA